MDFKLSNGPWTPLFQGVMQGHETELYANPDSLIIAIVYESENNQKKGALIECYKAFYCKGLLESFLETLPRKAIALLKHGANETFKFLLLDSGAAYAAFNEDSFIKESDALMARIQSFSSLVQEVSTAYDVDLLELENCTDEEKLKFYSLPLVGQLLSPTVKKKEETMRIELGRGEIMLGVTKKGTIVKEPFDFFDRTLISGGTKDDRMHLFHILIESSLLSGIPAMVIDWDGLFSGLHLPSNHPEELKKFNVDTDALGFPIKFFKLGTDLKADLSAVDPKSFLSAFGLVEKPQGAIIEQAFSMGKSQDLFQLIDRVAQIPEGEHVTPFKKREASRILMLIEEIYPGLFSGTNPIQELSSGRVKGIARANILLFDKADDRKNMLVLQSLVTGMLSNFRAEGKSDRLKALLFLSDGDGSVPESRAKTVNDRIASDLIQFREYGLGFILDSQNTADVARAIKGNAQASLAIINDNDVGVIVRNRKNYRVLVRPGLSKCTEKRTGAKALTQVRL